MTIAHTRHRERFRNEPVHFFDYFYEGTGSYDDWFTYDEHVESCRDSPHKGPPFTSGSPLELSNLFTDFNPPGEGINLTGYGGTSTTAGRRYTGNLCCVGIPYKKNAIFDQDTPQFWTPTRQAEWHEAFRPSDADLNAVGATAWAKFKPGKPLSSSDQAILELVKDGIPSVPGLRSIAGLVKAKKDLLKRIAGDYLNIEFGWKPIVNDLQNLYKAQRILDKRLAQLRRDNGFPVRRRGKLPVTINSEVIFKDYGNYSRPVMTTEFYGDASSPDNFRERSESLTTEVWFSGRFRYWIPDIGENLWPERTKAALFGLNPSPSLLYEVMPWSWLIDWFFNLGDVIDNMSTNAAENLVADYAYIMKRVTKTVHYDLSVVLAYPSTSENFVYTNRQSYGGTWKMRDQANPYGFGFTFDGLSWRQKAILTALGLTRT
jgi:hypothetical protein